MGVCENSIKTPKGKNKNIWQLNINQPGTHQNMSDSEQRKTIICRRNLERFNNFYAMHNTETHNKNKFLQESRI